MLKLLNECKVKKTQTPIGLVGKIELNWDCYRLEVWGMDVAGPPVCALQLYQIPYDASAVALSATPTSPNRGSLSDMYGPTNNLFLVEFIRVEAEIFAFKRFYQWVRVELAELVKRDYAFKLFDQAGSPM